LHAAQETRLPFLDLALIDVPLAATAVSAGGVGILVTGLLLGFRHGFDWDHIAAITDITSTTAAADAGTEIHEADHQLHPHDHSHPHGGRTELVEHAGLPEPVAVAAAHGAAAPHPHPHLQHGSPAGSPPPRPVPASLPAGGAAAVATMPSLASMPVGRARLADEQKHAIGLGTLYALGHALVVFALGMAALAFGALLPDWVDPIMGRVVGFTLLVLGIWVFVSLWQYLRNGTEFKLRSRWMLVFDGVRYSWRRFQARLHGHEHVQPLEMSSYGRRTAFGVGMIHGVGAETGSQALLIAAVGGASGAGLGVPMLVMFCVGLVAANTVIVVVSATGFVAGQVRRPIYIGIGVLAGVFSIAVGLAFLLGTESLLPDLTQLLGGGL
jgi:high-affinity nickel permease